MKYILSLIILNLLLVSSAFNQNAFEGVVTFKIEYENFPEGLLAVKDKFPTKMVTKIKGKKTRTEQQSTLGNTITINDDTKSTSTSLINMLGKKVAITLTKEEMDKERAKLGNDAPPQIDYIDADKMIAGQSCHKANITLEDDKTATIYYTKEIQSNTVSAPFVDLNGFPMKYKITTQGVSMAITAISVSKEKVADTEFDIPEDYTIMKAEDFQKSLGAQTE